MAININKLERLQDQWKAVCAERSAMGDQIFERRQDAKRLVSSALERVRKDSSVPNFWAMSFDELGALSAETLAAYGVNAVVLSEAIRKWHAADRLQADRDRRVAEMRPLGELMGRLNKYAGVNQ